MGIRTRFLLCLLVVLLPMAATALWTMRLVDDALEERIEIGLADSLRLEAARILQTLSRYADQGETLAASTWVRDSVVAVVDTRARVADRGRTGPDPGADDGAAGEPARALPVVGAGDAFVTIDPDLARPLDRLAERVHEEATADRSEIVDLCIVDVEGQVLGASAGARWKPRDPALIAEALESGRVRFGRAWRTAGDDGAADGRLGLVAPVLGRDGRAVGALLLETRLAPVLDLVSSHVELGSTTEAHVAQPDGEGGAEFITPLRFDGRAAFERVASAASHAPIVSALSAPATRVLRAPDYRGADSILAIRTLEPTGWGLVVKIDAAEAMGPVAHVRDVVRATLLATLALLVAVWLIALRPLGVRLQRTAAAAERVARGNLRTPVGDGRSDEVGELARTIDRLASDLEADRSMRSAAESRLRHQATHDELTGLANRKRANALIEELGETSTRPASVVFMDLDGFKAVNDVHGHGTGDEVLVEVAERLEPALPPRATLARWGGDEFVAVLPDTDARSAEGIARRLRASLDEPLRSSAGTHRIGCSVGVASSDEDRPLARAIVEADAAMYAEKHRRRSAGTIDAFAARAVESALDERRVELWVQPVVSAPGAKSGSRSGPGRVRLAGAEALVRLRTRDGGIIPPDDFLSAVRKAPLGRELDRRVLERAIEGLGRWRRAGVVDARFTLSINVTGASLRDPALGGELAATLERHRVPPASIVIEISEKTGDFDLSVLRELRDLGVRIALDDVGLHRSNIDRLVSVNPEIAKIDRQWLDDEVVLPRLVDLCRSLGFTLVAEGVETEAQLARLQALRVSRHQGYLFDRPRPAVSFVERWGRHGAIATIAAASTRLPDPPARRGAGARAGAAPTRGPTRSAPAAPLG